MEERLTRWDNAVCTMMFLLFFVCVIVCFIYEANHPNQINKGTFENMPDIIVSSEAITNIKEMLNVEIATEEGISVEKGYLEVNFSAARGCHVYYKVMLENGKYYMYEVYGLQNLSDFYFYDEEIAVPYSLNLKKEGEKISFEAYYR